MIPPIVEPVIFQKANAKRVRRDTIEEFNMTRADQQRLSGLNLHKFDHIEQNIQMAPNINQMRLNNLCFQRSILNKSNAQNLKVLQEQN